MDVVGKNTSSQDYNIGLDSVAFELVGGTPPAKTFVDAALIQDSNAIGAQVNRNDGSTISDYILFKIGTGSYLLNGVNSNADQSLVSRDSSNNVTGYAMTNGTSLIYNSQTLLEGSVPFNGSLSYNSGTTMDSGVVEATQDMSVNIYCHATPAQITVDGTALASNQYTYNGSTNVLTINTLTAGRHDIVIDYV